MGGGGALTAGVGHGLSPIFCLGSSAALAVAAFSIAALRVVNGYHDLAQVVVGAIIGVTGAWWWVALGAGMVRVLSPRAAATCAWAAYLGLSAIFIRKRILRSWVKGKREFLA
eukprot:CAMPEP_0171931050 /NCGR_PEP_ID=MMETSP0993-20121228/29125_1 /TAXON_ID=483369 /ORGANISM="non described non described, Strain CCMP2098" /LENGTH=112 /DNA_ID=CAMNT_0012570999 /DNA_START=1 /DNA_END=339 /DNA_ORIENTATION=+